MSDSYEKPLSLQHGKQELKSLHGLRFLAAFCILFSHACAWLTNFKHEDATISAIRNTGEFFATFGMPLFFVLSGFVIHYNYSNLFQKRPFTGALQEFFVARVGRLVPLFLCFVLVGVLVDGVIDWLVSRKMNFFLLAVHRLTLTQSWVYIPIFGDRLVLDEAYALSWSISTEMFFYFIYPVIALSLFLTRSTRKLISLGVLEAILVVGALTVCWFQLGRIEWFFQNKMGDIFHGEFQHSAIRWFFYYSPYTRIFEFLLGCITAQLFLTHQASPVSDKEKQIGQFVLAASLVALVFLSGYRILRPNGFGAGYLSFICLNFGCAAPIACLIFCVSRYEGLLTRFLSGAVIVALGEISYSIYTVHTYTLRIFNRPQADMTPLSSFEAILRISAGIALTLLLSTATYKFIEMPARRKIRQHFRYKGGDKAAGTSVVGRGMYAAFVAAVLVALVLYEFFIVPHFAPYTK